MQQTLLVMMLTLKAMQMILLQIMTTLTLTQMKLLSMLQILQPMTLTLQIMQGTLQAMMLTYKVMQMILNVCIITVCPMPKEIEVTVSIHLKLSLYVTQVFQAIGRAMAGIALLRQLELKLPIQTPQVRFILKTPKICIKIHSIITFSQMEMAIIVELMLQDG